MDLGKGRGEGRWSGAAALVAGSELSTLETAGDVESWRSVIAAALHAFGGQILYAANWDHYRETAPALWTLVDAAAISAYFPTAEWPAVRTDLERFRAALGKPLVLSEVGCPSQPGRAAQPWNEATDGPPDLEEQRRAIAAFIAAWDGAASLDAVFFWNWYGWGGPRSRGYTPRGKPAAAEIARWFGAVPTGKEERRATWREYRSP
jgi:hypothetical protein